MSWLLIPCSHKPYIRLAHAVIDFDDTDTAWRKYDPSEYYGFQGLSALIKKEKYFAWLKKAVALPY